MLSDRFSFFLEGNLKRGEVKISGWGLYPGGHYALTLPALTLTATATQNNFLE